MVDIRDIFSWIKALQAIYQINRKHLTDLDAAIGDADLGINMDRGFTRVVEGLDLNQVSDVSGLLKTVAMTLIKTVGGAAGPLYGTFFLRASGVCTGKDTLDSDDIVAMLEAGHQGVAQRGRAVLGDKTMLDALVPGIEEMKQQRMKGAGLEKMLMQGVRAARQGMQDTIPMLARKGRASYLGKRSIGHQDPGATSAYLMLKTMAEVFAQQ